MTTNFVSYRTRSIGAEVSQDPLDRFSQSLHHMVDIEWQMINPSFFFRLNSATNATTSCKILVKIGPVVSEEKILI